MEKKKAMISALEGLRASFKGVLDVWEEYDLDTKGVNEGYPFKRSFDEVECAVFEWTEKVIEVIENKG